MAKEYFVENLTGVHNSRKIKGVLVNNTGVPCHVMVYSEDPQQGACLYKTDESFTGELSFETLDFYDFRHLMQHKLSIMFIKNIGDQDPLFVFEGQLTLVS